MEKTNDRTSCVQCLLNVRGRLPIWMSGNFDAGF